MSTLTAAELPEARHTLSGLRGAKSQLLRRAIELGLGLCPRAGQGKHHGVVVAAHAEQGSQAVSLAVLLDSLAPLRGAREVANALAAVDHPAARAGDQFGIAHLPGRRGRRGLIQRPHAPGDGAFGNASDATDRSGVHLYVEGFEPFGEFDRVVRVPARLLHVAGEHEGEERVPHRQHGVLR